MPIKTSGEITIDDIVAEFGGNPAHSLNEYYRGGGLVPNKNVNKNIPLAGSGEEITLEDFYGTARIIALSYSMIGGGGAGGQGYENGAGSGRAGSGQESGIFLKTEFDRMKADNQGRIPDTFGQYPLRSTDGGLGGAHGSRQVLEGGAGGGTTEYGAGGAGAARNSAAPASPWGNWGAGGGGGGGDQGGSNGWDLLGIIGYGSTDPWGQSGAGGGAGTVQTGTIDIDTEIDYVLVAGKAGALGSVGNYNGAYGVPGYIEFTIDTVPSQNYEVLPAGTGSNSDRTTTTAIGMRLNAAGVPSFFTV